MLLNHICCELSRQDYFDGVVRDAIESLLQSSIIQFRKLVLDATLD